MFVVGHIAKLVAHDSGVANYGVDVGMGMAINPGVYAAIYNEVAQFCGEGSI
jgi:hypothetical protein